MEIERPKLKKKKKVRRVSDEEQELENDLKNLSLDIDFPQSSVDSFKDVDLTDLQKLVEANAKRDEPASLSDKGCESVKSDKPNGELEKFEEIKEDVLEAPSAPSFEEEEVIAEPVKVVPVVHSKLVYEYDKSIYPDLQEVTQSVNVQISEKILSPVAIKPFTPLQIEQLYSNREIQLIEMFEEEFVNKELKDASIQEHPLYTLLKKYGKSRAKYLINLRNISHLTKTLDTNYQKIWRVEKRTVSGHGFCECGKAVRASHDYNYARFDEDINSEMTKNLKELMNMSCFNHTKFSQDYELCQRQIEQMIGELMNSKAFENIPKDSPVVLNEVVYPDMKSKINELRLYISILFKFLRDAVHDKFLITSVQNWIKQLVSLQLRVATWQDHVFILFHILRCPVGVGNWAAQLIQVPTIQRTSSELQSPFSFPEFQHCVALLAALLLPVKDRGTFLEGITKDLVPVKDSDENVEDEIWILVDSEGEEGSSPSGECIGLKENDLVAIYDQIPFENIFLNLTQAEKKGDGYEVDLARITAHHILKSVAFSAKFIAILNRGLTTYDSERYKQFAKRLGRLMKHTLFFVSDIIQLYHSRDGYKDPEECLRIQVEFDELIVRSAYFIYESKKLSLFQYLADFPYDLVSIKTLWKLFYYLHVGDFKVMEEDVTRLILDENFSMKFNDDVATDDLFFLLHAFAQMALAKGRDDFDFILFITLDLLQIGFINEGTRDFCYNTVKNLLTNITTKYPDLIANVFSYLKDNLQKVGTLSSYLFKALPIAKWVPKTEDLEVLASWLLNFDFDSIENTTARVIFAYMNWNFDGNDELFLPHEIHVRMAFLVMEVYSKHIGEVIGSGVMALQIGSNKKNPTKKEQFSMWCWSMASVLRLHYMDLNKQMVVRLLNDPGVVNMVPEIETTDGIYQGFTEQKPLAIYLSILVSQLGHSIPQICHRGFDQLKLLLNDYRHSKVIRCLEFITPLFVNCQSSLYSCEAFMSILSALFSADKTYAKMAKEAMTADARGPVLTFLGNMIQHQLTNYARYGWNSPSDLIQLWINCLIRLKEWSKDSGVVWILDLICQIAYQYNEAWTFTREILRPAVIKIVDTKIPKNTGLLNLMSAEDKDILITPTADAPTLSLLLIELEFENIELNTGFWSEFLCQLLIQNGASMPTVLKKTLTLKQLPAFSYNYLAVFKFMKLIIKMHPKHVMFPIICQQFFSLYLHRVPGDVSNHEYGVQDKFYDVDVTMMKKLKRIFIDSEILHNDMATKFTTGSKSQFHTHCAKLFKTFLLWLEETQLNKMTQQNIILPPQYDHARLKMIFCGNRCHWTEFIYLPELRQSQQADCNSWLAICMRYTSPAGQFARSRSVDSSSGIDCVKEKMFHRFKMNAKPLDPPELVKLPVHIGAVDSSKATLQLLRNESKVLQTFAHQFNMMVSEHKAVDAAYRDTIRLSYSNESSIRLKSVSCSRVFDNCQGSTTIRLEFSEAKSNENVKHKLEDNREFQRQMVLKESREPEPKVVDAHFCLHNIIQQLLDQYDLSQRRNDKEQCERILKIGTSFFYEILKDINEEVQSCPVTHELYSETISHLGSFVQQNHNTEGQNLLKLALQRPNLVNLIAELFTPSVSAPPYFLEMYKSLVDSYAKRCDPQLLFVLFSKFDVIRWLTMHKPKLIDISNLIQQILRGLELWNMQNSELLQDLLRCHLTHLFFYQFPSHYGEILQSVLTGFSTQRLKPNVLLDLLNAFYQRVGCSKLDPVMNIGRMKDELRNFASKQNLLMYNDVHSTSLMLAHHFYTERLQYGLHGLYPKFSEYSDVLCFLMGSIGHSAVASAIQAYPGIMADQLVNWLWPCLSEMFAPWLVPYYPGNMKDAPAAWIQQFTSSALQPWSEIHSESAGKVIRVFAMCLQYILDMLPASNLLMGHLFCWFDGYYAHKTTPKHVLLPIQALLMKMPWERFRPMPVHMEGLNRILMDYVPDCHQFVGNVFLRIAWTPWLQQNMSSWDYQTVQRMLSILLMVFVKLSYEPKVRESIRIIQILQDAVKYPWHLLEYKDVESVLDWFVMSAEPSVILKIPSDHETIDSCVISLLQVASCMKETPKDAQNMQKTVVTAKRMAYVRASVRLLKSSDAKLHQLMATKQGQDMFHQACIALLNSIESCFTNASDESSTVEATNLMVTVLQNMAVPESTSKLFADSIGIWQSTSQTGNVVLCCSLNALKVQKHWTLTVYQVLESTLFNYLRVSELTPNHVPTWTDAHQRFSSSQAAFDPAALVTNDFFLSAHLLSYMRLVSLSDDTDRVSYLQDLQNKLVDRKTTEATEAKAVLLWGFLIMSGGHILMRSEAAKQQLLIIARYFQVNLTQPEGWGDGLLGAIGLKKDPQSNKKKILLRCLSCAIFAIFTGPCRGSPVRNVDAEYESAMTELKGALSNKKFAEVRMIGLQAISLIESKKDSMLDGFIETICTMIRMFYEDSFLNSIEYFYHW